jgi:hypothetical protein
MVFWVRWDGGSIEACEFYHKRARAARQGTRSVARPAHGDPSFRGSRPRMLPDADFR